MAIAKFTSFEDTLSKAAAAGIETNTKNSLEWFRKELKTLKNVTERKLIASDELQRVQRPMIGRMYMFGYDPKGKKTLPYYDRFPLIILAGKAEGGFYGLNLHYLDYIQRAKFFDVLRQKMLFSPNQKEANDNMTRFMINFEKLSRSRALRAFQPCWKHYLTSQVRTKIMKVPTEYWEPALFLPCDNFAKSSNTSVWQESFKQFKSL